MKINSLVLALFATLMFGLMSSNTFAELPGECLPLFTGNSYFKKATQLNDWLVEENWKPDQLFYWLGGNGFLTPRSNTNSPLILIKILDPRLSEIFATRIAYILNNNPEDYLSKNIPKREFALLLKMSSLLDESTILFDPLYNLFDRARNTPGSKLDSLMQSEYWHYPIRSALLDALMKHQIDSRLLDEFLAMSTGNPNYLRGRPEHGKYGIKRISQIMRRSAPGNSPNNSDKQNQ